MNFPENASDWTVVIMQAGTVLAVLGCLGIHRLNKNLQLEIRQKRAVRLEQESYSDCGRDSVYAAEPQLLD